MKEEITNAVLQRMLPILNNAQLLVLREAVLEALETVEIRRTGASPTLKSASVSAFISAKRVEGCSEKTLRYYQRTIEAMVETLKKAPEHISTADLRDYLTDYQRQRQSSKVTIDNIRRILSTFFSWLEDEDYIVKSPARRIHKVRTAKVVKDVYGDEDLEQMRDHCGSLRDLAMIDLLASSGMRVGELVTLNRDDINFSERECVVLGKGSKERIVYFDARTKIHLQNYLHRLPRVYLFVLFI